MPNALLPEEPTFNPLWQGMIRKGNIDVGKRPIVRNPDGSISTISSMSVNMDGVEWLIPTIRDDGRRMSPQEAIQYFRQTGRHLGAFATPDAATSFAKSLSERQGNTYGAK